MNVHTHVHTHALLQLNHGDIATHATRNTAHDRLTTLDDLKAEIVAECQAAWQAKFNVLESRVRGFERIEGICESDEYTATGTLRGMGT